MRRAGKVIGLLLLGKVGEKVGERLEGKEVRRVRG